MGNCVGPAESAEEKAQRQRNEAINKALQEASKQAKEEIKILLLGAGESGKSTIAKQMKIIHLSGWTPDEKKEFMPILVWNIIKPMQILIEQAEKRQFILSEENQAYAAEVMDIKTGKAVVFDAEMARKITSLYTDPAIKQTLALSNQFQISDSSPYFLNDCARFAVPGYVPTELDILRIRQKTTGIVETVFTVKKKCFRMVDVGGQRNERKKWIHCFEDVTAIIFCVALNDYDLMLEEDETVNRMHEALKLFGEIISNGWFQNTSTMLFLNKKDLFDEKIKKVDLKCCFSNYDGGLDYDNGVKYIKNKFLSKNTTAERVIYPHLTCATDTQNVEFVFNAIQDILIRKIIDVDIGL